MYEGMNSISPYVTYQYILLQVSHYVITGTIFSFNAAILHLVTLYHLIVMVVARDFLMTFLPLHTVEVLIENSP